MLKKSLFGGVAAGIMVGIGGAVFMACDNRYVGAVLFSVALLSICMLDFYLFTGKVGFIAEKFSFSDLGNLIIGLVGNFVGATAVGYLVSFAKPDLIEKAVASCTNKLSNGLLTDFVLGILCGILMYVSVKIYKEKDSVWGILFCIPVFILCGFEHSIANMFYFALANMLGGDYFLFILMVILGNAVGGMLIPWLVKLGKAGKSKNVE